MHYLLKYLLFLFLLFIYSCSNNKVQEKIDEKYPSGKPKIVSVYQGKGGKAVKIKEIKYYESGKKEQEGLFKDNQRDSLWQYWYENGQKWSEGHFKNGKGEGKRLVWFQNGQLQYEGHYTNGIPTGKWTFWDSKGEKIKEVDYSKSN